MTTPVSKQGMHISRTLRKAATQPLDGESSEELPIPIKNTFIDYPVCLTPETAQHMKVRHSKSGHPLPTTTTSTTPVSKQGTRASRTLRKAATEPLDGESSGEIPIPIKNTFIDYPVSLTPETAKHMKVRHNKSGPAGLDPIPDRLRLSRDKSSSREVQVKAPKEKMETCGKPSRSAISGLATPSRSRAESQQPRVILLNEALRPGPLGSPEMPSEGSMGHHLGTCKPCAFNHRRGCESGVHCEFCHLCDAGERKRRQKERHRQHYQESRMAGVLPRAPAPSSSPTAASGRQPCAPGRRA